MSNDDLFGPIILNPGNGNSTFPPAAEGWWIPYIVEVLNFRLVGRKYMLTAGRVGPLPPSCTVVQSTGSALNTVGRQKSETETQR